MIGTRGDASLAVHTMNRLGAVELENLRDKINNEDYLREAIQRIALTLSNELLDIPQGGISYERQRKGRK